MKTFEEILKDGRLRLDFKSDDGFRAFIRIGGWDGTCICSNGAGWEHVSVSPIAKRIMPTWDDMCKVKDMFWNEDEAVIQIHPPKEQYVNNKENCLHLWRCTYKDMVLPPSVLVGVRDGQKRSEFMQELKEAYELAGETF